MYDASSVTLPFGDTEAVVTVHDLYSNGEVDSNDTIDISIEGMTFRADLDNSRLTQVYSGDFVLRRDKLGEYQGVFDALSSILAQSPYRRDSARANLFFLFFS